MTKTSCPSPTAINGNTSVTQADHPFTNLASNILTLESIGTSNYNALNVKVQNQMSHGLEFLANYSWQKNLQSAVAMALRPSIKPRPALCSWTPTT